MAAWLLACCCAMTPPRWARATTAKPVTTAATRPLHLKIDGHWYDVTAWADKHPGGKYVLEWADGYDVTNAFHTIHLFGSKKSSDVLAKLPAADLTQRDQREQVLPPIDRAPMAEQQPTFMDRFMWAGEQAVRLASPPASALPEQVPVSPAAGLAWQPREAAMHGEAQQRAQAPAASSSTTAPSTSEGRVGESALKRDLEDMLRRHFSSPAEYKATPEHWARIAAAFALWAACLTGWVSGSLPATLLLPYAQWLLFSPTVHESSHSTLSTVPWVNKAAAFCGLPFIYNPYIWWPQHILSHHQYTNDDALDVDLHHLRPARLHPGCEVDGGYSGANFIFKGYFSTIGMSVLWPVRVLQRKSTGRWYANLITPKPDRVSDLALAVSFAPVAFVLVWPWVRVLTGEISALEGFFDWFYPWAVTGAIWTVMTQVSHVQEDCQRPPTGDVDDYFRWQIESAVDYSVGSETVPKLTASLSLQSMHHVMPSVCGCHFAGLYPEYKRICEKHAVRMNTRKDVSAAWRSCIARVYQLSSPEQTPAWALLTALHDDEPRAVHEAPDSQVGQGAPAAALAEHAPLVAYFATPAVAMLACSPFF